MRWYKRLRWRLIGSQFLVVLVGVGIMLVVTQLFLSRMVPTLVQANLSPLIANVAERTAVEAQLLLIFRNIIYISLAVAALAALGAGVVSSFILWRVIIAPLHQVAQSSQRVANGRYGERVDVPSQSGEAMAQLVINFNQMADALERVEEQRVALLGNISHELRTPLTGLKGYLEGLVDRLFPANDETFGWMSEEVVRLQRLVEDLQHLSRVEAGQIRLQLAPFDVEQLARRVVAQLQPQLQEKGVMVGFEMPKTAVIVHADPDRTAQVLLNLLSNGLRYSPVEGEMRLRVAVAGEFAQISVQDFGVGIPAEALPYLFERFYRVDQSRARNSGGSGIGLTISRHLVWAMGGELLAASEGEGKGSSFTFTLPLAGGG